MSRKHSKPWVGMTLALLTAAGLLVAGVALWPVMAALAVWILSLWLNWLRPARAEEPRPLAERPDVDGISRSAMRTVIEPISLPLVLTDSKRIIAANAAARAAFGAHIVGQDVRIALRHPDAVGLLDGDGGASVTIRGLTGAGSLWQLTRERIDPRYWSIELRDRTAEADIGRAHTDFVANASHELRTPLSSIIGYVETLAEDPSRVDPATTSRFLGTVLREARRMQNLVADLMSLSQLEAEKHDLPTEQIDMGQLAARVVAEFPAASSHGETSQRLLLDKSEGTYPVTGDAKQLEQLLRNLIDNALKYGDDDKPVSVTLGLASRGIVKLGVTDRGAGIAAEHLPHLTRRFYRTDPGRSRAAGGTGLGLAIVKHIVERHRGKLDIASKLGDGTTVTVRLPLAAGESGE